MLPPNANDLIQYMPDAVLREFVAYGGGEHYGVKAPSFIEWMTKSTHPFVEAWCDYVRKYARWTYEKALKRQKVMNDHASEFYGKQNGMIRNRGVIDPVLMAFNRKCFDSPEAIRDTQQKEQKLFIK